MQYLTLAFTATAALASVASLAILVRFAKEAKTLQNDVETVKAKTIRNAKRISDALKELEV